MYYDGNLFKTLCQSFPNIHLLFLYCTYYFTQAAVEKAQLKAVVVHLYLYHVSAICIIPLPQQLHLVLCFLAVLFFRS